MATSILIVEDDHPVADSLRALLSSKGYDISMAYNGAEGLATAERNKPNIMLLDIILPKMGGFEVCQTLKSNPDTKKIKIIMMTALDSLGDIEEALQHGADDYVIKPFDTEQLLKKIQKAA